MTEYMETFRILRYEGCADEAGGVSMVWREDGELQAMLVPLSSELKPQKNGVLRITACELLHDPSVTLQTGTMLQRVAGGARYMVTGDDSANRAPKDAGIPLAWVTVEERKWIQWPEN